MICWGLGDTNTGAAVGCGFPGGQTAKRRVSGEEVCGLVLQKVKACLYPPAKGEWRCGLSMFKGTARSPPTPTPQTAVLSHRLRVFLLRKHLLHLFRAKGCLGLKEVKAVVL